jgi:hypothetical protein
MQFYENILTFNVISTLSLKIISIELLDKLLTFSFLVN